MHTHTGNQKLKNGIWHAAAIFSVASAATVNLASATSNNISITGNTGPISSFGTVDAGVVFDVTFVSTPTLTHHATQLNLPNGGANIIVQAGDRMSLRSDGNGNFTVLNYVRASGFGLQDNDTIATPNLTSSFLLDDTLAAGDLVTMNSGVVSKFCGDSVTSSLGINNVSVLGVRIIPVSPTQVLVRYTHSTKFSFVIGTLNKYTGVWTFGTQVDVSQAHFGTNYGDMIMVSATEFVSTYVYQTVSNVYMQIVSGSISGATITLGTESQILCNNSGTLSSATVRHIGYVSPGKAIVTYGTGSGAAMAVVTISGGAITGVTGASGGPNESGGFTYLSNGVILVSDLRNSVGNYTTVAKCTVTGTSYSIGTSYILSLTQSIFGQGFLTTTADRVMYMHVQSNTFKYQLINTSGATPTSVSSGTVAGTASAAVDFLYNSTKNIFYIRNSDTVITLNSSMQILKLYTDTYNTGRVVFTGIKSWCLMGDRIANLAGSTVYGIGTWNNPANLLGIMSESGIASQTKKVFTLGPVIGNLSGLIPDEYVYKGSTSITQVLNGAPIGKAISATEVILAYI